MRVVVDTNVVISGTFFGGAPRRIIEAIVAGRLTAFATTEIIEEYFDVVGEMILRKQGGLRKDLWSYFASLLIMIESKTTVAVCRDEDDDKFISCAVDAGASYIISGDKDLLDLKQYEEISIMSVAEFCELFL